MNHDIIQKIKDENIKPISKNTFLLKKILIWFSFAMSTVFGAYAFAFFFLKTLYIDFDNWYFFANSYDRFLMDNIPLIWVGLFCISLISMFFLFKKTNRGYKYSVAFIGVVSVVISFSLGIILAKTLAYKGVLVDRFADERLQRWTNPEEGRLSGEILFVNDDEQYVLIRDIKDDVWNVSTRYLLDASREALEYDQLVSIIGRYDYENNFTACQIMPLDMNRNRFRPNPANRFNPQSGPHNDIVKSICDFVINKN